MSNRSWYLHIAPLYLGGLALGSAYACTSSSDAPAPANLDAGVPSPEGGASDAPAASETSSDANVTPDATSNDAWSRAGCTTPPGPATQHAGTVSQNETWTAAGSPHVINSGLTIAAGVTVTIEPCAEVTLDPEKIVIVDGTLVAKATQDHAILFRPTTAGQRYGQIRVIHPGKIDLDHVDIEGGGSGSTISNAATLSVEGAWPIVHPIKARALRVRNSAGLGIWMWKWAAFDAASENVVITGSGAVDATYPYPLRVSANAIGSIPSGTYTGNAKDEIQIFAESPHYRVEGDDVIHDRGVPYHVGGNGAFGQLEVIGPSGLATLTVDPGVTMRFETKNGQRGYLSIGDSPSEASPTGALVAAGTAAKPITFGSGNTPGAAGDWVGLTFDGKVHASTKLDYVVIENAGSESGATGFGCPPLAVAAAGVIAGVAIYGEPSTAFVTNTTIQNSAGHGIYRAWTNQGATTVDLMPSNTFVGVANCKQVEPKPSNSVCPASPACP